MKIDYHLSNQTIEIIANNSLDKLCDLFRIYLQKIYRSLWFDCIKKDSRIQAPQAHCSIESLAIVGSLYIW